MFAQLISLLIYAALMFGFFYFWQSKDRKYRLTTSITGTIVSVIIFAITIAVFHFL